MKKRWKIAEPLNSDQQKIKANISENLKCPAIISEILIRKGLSDINEIQKNYDKKNVIHYSLFDDEYNQNIGMLIEETIIVNGKRKEYIDIILYISSDVLLINPIDELINFEQKNENILLSKMIDFIEKNKFKKISILFQKGNEDFKSKYLDGKLLKLIQIIEKRIIKRIGDV